MSGSTGALARLRDCVTRVEDGIIVVGRTSEEDADAALAAVEALYQAAKEMEQAGIGPGLVDRWHALAAAVRRVESGDE